VPLPLASLTNRRSFMHVDNFAEAILATIRSRCYGVFITTDSKPTTPEELYRQMVQCAGHSPRLFTATHVGRLILRRLLGKRGGSLFESAAFDGGRFAATTGVRWAIEEEQIVADTMRTRSL
jgi:nucleoside-diphosphate-sugar epimerase